MNTLLRIDSSLGDGESNRLTARYATAHAAAHPGARVIERDLARDPVPHLTRERFAAFTTAPDARSPQQHDIVAESDRLVAELRHADKIVLGLPMYNFGVPSTLKAYFDHVARAGVTFRYGANGPEGLLAGKRAVVVATRGGRHAGTALDTESAYVRDFLAFLGIVDVEFVYAEGLALGAEARAQALADAQARIDAMFIAQRAAA